MAICSFTRAAAAEIGRRVQGLDQSKIGTLHALCYRALGKPQIAERHGLESWNEYAPIPQWQLGAGAKRADPEVATADAVTSWDTEGEQLLADVGIMRARMVPVAKWSRKLARFHEHWMYWKTLEGFVDFTDLLEHARTDVDACPGNPSVIMSDESQDMTTLEFEVLRKWGRAASQLVTVGDQDQCIYSWRGADPAAFVSTEASWEHTLSQSYRVPRAVHKYAVQWIEQVRTRIPVKYEPRDALGKVTVAPLRLDHPEGIVNWLTRHLDDHNGDVMLLASCNYMLDKLCAALKAEGLSYHNPYRFDNGLWNPMRGANRILSFLRPDVDTFGDEHGMWTWQDLAQWVEPLRAKGLLLHGAKARIEREAKPDRFDKAAYRSGHDVPGREVRASDLLNLFEPSAVEWLLDVGSGPDRTREAVRAWLDGALAARRRQLAYGATVYDRHGGRALRETPRIIVGTVHSVKGGEATTVVVWPDISRLAYGGWQYETDPSPARDAIRRMFYVAFTRARETLVLGQPSGQTFVDFPPPGGAS